LCWDKLKACRKTRVKDVENGDDGITSRKSNIITRRKPFESDLSKVAFVDDKYIENFETLENTTKSLELRLEDRTRELADLILNINKNNLPEVRKNNVGPGVEDRTKTVEDKLEERTRKLEDKLEDRTKKLEEKLDLILNNNKQTENQMNLVLKLKDRTEKLENKLEDRTKMLEDKLEDRTKMLEEKLDLILDNNKQAENQMNLVLKLKDRTKKLENKLEDRTKTLEDKLNTILEHLKSNK